MKIHKKRLGINIIHRAKDIKRKKNVKIFWINNNVYVLEKRIGKNILNILYCNDKRQYKGKIHIPNDMLSNFLYFMDEDLKLGNTKFKISFKKQFNEWNDMFKHTLIIE